MKTKRWLYLSARVVVCIAMAIVCSRSSAADVASTPPTLTQLKLMLGLPKSATSTVDVTLDPSGNPTVTTSNTRFLFHLVQNNFVDDTHDNQYSLLLQETNTITDSFSLDGAQSSFSVVAWIGDLSNPAHEVWSIKQIGDEATVAEEYNFYRVEEYHEIDTSAVYSFYSLLNGMRLYNSVNEDLFRIEVPNVNPNYIRYAAYGSRDSVDAPTECIHDRDNVGVIQYGTQNSIQDRILVRAAKKRDGLDGDTRFAEITSSYGGKLATTSNGGLTLWHTDGISSLKALSHFSLRVSFPRGKAFIELPITNDQIDWQHVVHSDDITLQDIHKS